MIRSTSTPLGDDSVLTLVWYDPTQTLPVFVEQIGLENFSPLERAQIQAKPGLDRWAGRFAAKLAVLGVLGQGGLSDVEILSQPNGQPVARVHTPDAGGHRTPLVSVSHHEGLAGAWAVLPSDEDEP